MNRILIREGTPSVTNDWLELNVSVGDTTTSTAIPQEDLLDQAREFLNAADECLRIHKHPDVAVLRELIDETVSHLGSVEGNI